MWKKLCLELLLFMFYVIVYRMLFSLYVMHVLIIDIYIYIYIYIQVYAYLEKPL
jgi:hypothetical protein